TSQPMEMVNNRKALELTFEMINAETQLLYSSDYPHWDMDLPSTIFDLPFLSVEAKRNILGENARRLFNLEPVQSETKRRRLAARELPGEAEGGRERASPTRRCVGGAPGRGHRDRCGFNQIARRCRARACAARRCRSVPRCRCPRDRARARPPRPWRCRGP